jgi:hypothetical protein
MPGTEGRKRLEPRMTRGSWKFTAWAAGAQVVSSALLTLNNLRPDDGWDAASFWVFLTWFAISAIYFLYLLRVRQNDAPFWDEEEARRADWDHRGRQL